MKKIMGLSALALASVIAFTGCNKSSIDVDKANELMEQMQEHLNSPKEMTGIEMKKTYLEWITNLSNTAVDHNYTFIEDGSEVSRVEYTEGVTKVYHYRLDKAGNKTDEVYREIHDDYVYTYVTTEDNEKLYSKVPLLSAKSENSLLTFDPSRDVAKVIEGSGVVTWNIAVWSEYYNDAYSVLSDVYNAILEMPAERFYYEYNLSQDGEKIVVTRTELDFREGDIHDNEEFRLTSFRLEGTNTSYKEYSTGRTVHEGIPDVITQDNNDTSYTSVSSHELTFDKENTINFDKTGYQLVDTYLNE